MDKMNIVKNIKKVIDKIEQMFYYIHKGEHLFLKGEWIYGKRRQIKGT